MSLRDRRRQVGDDANGFRKVVFCAITLELQVNEVQFLLARGFQTQTDRPNIRSRESS